MTAIKTLKSEIYAVSAVYLASITSINLSFTDFQTNTKIFIMPSNI
jgi:hypothetical protein